jgi:4-hydroxybenzoate polyprenyltransferase
MFNRIKLYVQLVRLHRPVGIVLLLWPTLWALWIGSRGEPGWELFAIFFLGTVLMRSAGCAINDWADRDFDKHVQRTANRPLTSGAIKPIEAVLIFVGLSLLAFLLILSLNKLTIGLSFVGAFLAASYPFTKRFLALPQAYLGIAFGFGIPMAFAATQESVPLSAWVMLGANIFWALAYDTEYAMVDRDDDLKIGIRTAAITFGKFDVLAVMICYFLTLALLALVGWLEELEVWYFLGLIVAGLIACYHYALIRTRSKEGCFKAFNHNNWFGAAIFVGVLANYLIP